MNSLFFRHLTSLRGGWLAASLWLGAAILAGCGGSQSAGSTDAPLPDFVDFSFHVIDVVNKPIAGADVVVSTQARQYQAATDSNGLASFASLPTGGATIVVSASGFDTENLDWWFDRNGTSDVILQAERAWAIGRPVILGTRAMELSRNRGSMIFAVDIAVIGENAEALETLTSDDFSLSWTDCGWGGPRDCISNAFGNHTGSVQPDGPALSFELMPAVPRHAYRVGVLAERSASVTDWDQRIPALKKFFAMLGGIDAVSLASVEAGNNGTSLSILGPYTSDGASYLPAIDELAQPAAGVLDLQPSLLDWIRDAAIKSPGETPGAVRTVLVAATTGASVAEIAEATTLAQQSGVRLSFVTGYGYGLPEMAVRTGGFVTFIDDARQLGLVFAAMDKLLSGSLPFYRMTFRINSEPTAFMSGGNAKINMVIRLPTSIPNRGVYTTFDVAIP